MNSNDLYNFIVTAEEGSHSKAAQKLFMTTQGVSKSIRGLEETVGVPLLIRSARGIELTERGKAFLERAKEVYRSMEELEHMFDGEVDSLKGTLSVSSALGILEAVTPEVLFSFCSLYPNVQVKVREDTDRQVEEEVASGKADVGLAVLPVDEKQFEVYPFATKKVVALIYPGHRLYGRSRISVRDLEGESIILENENFKVHEKFHALCQSYGFAPKIYFETTEIAMAHRMAHLKKGIAISVETANGTTHYDELKAAAFKDPFYWEWAVITRKDQSPLIQAFLDYLVR